jgi:hypothetical protein
MADLPPLPTVFASLGPDEERPVQIVVRPNVDQLELKSVLVAIHSVEWAELHHAYGPAEDVADQLIAVAVGDDATREAAWWNLWGNIHHQGTIYEATVPAVPILGQLAHWSAFPDRPEAIGFLREVARAEGQVAERLRADIDEIASSLLSSWSAEPPPVKRALLWFLSALPHLQGNHADLIHAELPDQFREIWLLLMRGAESQEEFDAIVAFEHWVHHG